MPRPTNDPIRVTYDGPDASLTVAGVVFIKGAPVEMPEDAYRASLLNDGWRATEGHHHHWEGLGDLRRGGGQ